MNNTVRALAALTLAVAHLPLSWGQALCNSDGTPRPTTVFERFIHADCEACWTDPKAPAPSASAAVAVLDWIVPSPATDEAPLSAAATHDAQLRLQSIDRTLRGGTDVHISAVEPLATAGAAPRVRVARGLPFNDYLGTAIEFTPGRATAHQQVTADSPWNYYLALVEAVPAGTEGTAVPRQIVRNVLQGSWKANEKRSAHTAWAKWMEARPMRIPDGAKPERLQMVGWVQDAAGHIVAAAQSVCR